MSAIWCAILRWTNGWRGLAALGSGGSGGRGCLGLREGWRGCGGRTRRRAQAREGEGVWGTGGLRRWGGTRSDLKFAPALFLMPCVMGCPDPGYVDMLMPGHIVLSRMRGLRCAREAIRFFVARFAPSWKIMPSLVRAETRLPASVKAILIARRRLYAPGSFKLGR